MALTRIGKGNSANTHPFHEGVTQMAKQGQSFSTGNSTVAGLPNGTQLVVGPKGNLTITFVPAPVGFKAGDRINTKHGKATVMRLTTRLQGTIPGLTQTQVLYVADSDPVVRVANLSEVSAACKW
jgi:hypothetical protein